MNLKKSFGIVLLEKVKGGIKMKIIVGGILQKGDKILIRMATHKNSPCQLPSPE